MDPLDTVLATLRVRESMVGRSFVVPPWSLTLDSDEPCVLAAVIRGDAWASRGDDEPRHLRAGAVVVAHGGRPLVVADHPATPPQIVVRDAATCYDVESGDDLYDHERIGTRTWGSPDAPTAVLLGAYRTDGEMYRLLEADLPDMMIVGPDPDVSALLEVVVGETDTDRPGQQVVVDRLMELLLFASLRAWVSSSDARRPTWSRALHDPDVGAALRAMHGDPAAKWTVASLAAAANTSRATFAQRFTAEVGEPPLTHLTRWRMALAADLLRDRSLALGHIARRVGYADAFSFSSAFRRVRGESPSQYRDRLV